MTGRCAAHAGAARRQECRWVGFGAFDKLSFIV